MYLKQILTAFLLLMVLACTKKNTKPEYPDITTIVEGRVTRKYTHVPVSTTITLQSSKPYESTGFCLFCPDSTIYDIASVETDSNGYYRLEGTTNENLGSTIVRCGATSYGLRVQKGMTTTGINFSGSQYIMLKESFHVINNNKPPLAISVPISCCIGWIYAVDTTFTFYGASLDTGVTTYNGYRYTDNGIEKGKSEGFYIGGYADTLTYSFTVDPSAF